MTVSPSSADPETASYGEPMPDVESWDEPLVAPHPSRALDRTFRRRAGMVPNIVPYVAPHPWLYRPFLFLSAPTAHAIGTDLVSAIGFVVARANACRFCFGTFWSFLRMAGYTESDLDRLEANMYIGDLAHAERDALRFAVHVSKGRLEPSDGGDVQPLLDEGVRPLAVREIGGAAVLGTFVNRVSTMLAAPLHRRLEDMTSSWYFDLIQPIVGPLLSGWQQLGPSTPALQPEQVTGPLADWLRTLQGTSLGTLVQDLTNQWLHHEFALPQQTKLLMLAVVARGLHSTRLEETAHELLTERTDLSPREVEAAVDHLGGPDALDTDAQLLELARASIWYETNYLQRAARRHTEHLSRDETLDAVASIALVNALGRLRVLFQLDE